MRIRSAGTFIYLGVQIVTALTAILVGLKDVFSCSRMTPAIRISLV